MTDDTTPTDNPLRALFGEPDDVAEAMKRAQLGEYDTTLLEQWDLTLAGHINSFQQPINMNNAHSLLMHWTFFEHRHLPLYMKYMTRLLAQARDALTEVIDASPKHRDALFKEAKRDFFLHKDMYREVIARFTELQSFWQEDWMTIDITTDTAAAAHAATVDAMNILAGQYGLLIELRSLAEYGFDDDVDGVWLKDRVEELTEDRKHRVNDLLLGVAGAAAEGKTDE